MFRIFEEAVAVEADPTLPFIVEDEKVLGLIGLAIASSIIIEGKRDVALAILPDEGEIVGHIDESRGGEFLKGTIGR